MFANKELDKITNILNTFLKPFDCTAFAGTDFRYYPQNNIIEFALVVNDPFAKSFMNFAESLNPVHADIFLWSFFHELGHAETENEFDDDDDTEYLKSITSAKTDIEYYNIPQEYAATDWAGKFMIEHGAEVAQLWKELAPAIATFYNVMEVK